MCAVVVIARAKGDVQCVPWARLCPHLRRGNTPTPRVGACAQHLHHRSPPRRTITVCRRDEAVCCPDSLSHTVGIATGEKDAPKMKIGGFVQCTHTKAEWTLVTGHAAVQCITRSHAVCFTKNKFTTTLL